MREKIARGRIAARLANVPRCLIGIEAGMATHYVARELGALGHDVKQVPPAYSKPFRQGHKNDFRDAHAIAEAVQRPSTRCVPVKTDDQLDLQALHRVRSRLVGQRTAVINQIRGFLLEHGIPVRQGYRFLRQQLPQILATRTDVLSPRMIRIVGDLMADWKYLDERIEGVTDEIEGRAGSAGERGGHVREAMRELAQTARLRRPCHAVLEILRDERDEQDDEHDSHEDRVHPTTAMVRTPEPPHADDAVHERESEQDRDGRLGECVGRHGEQRDEGGPPVLQEDEDHEDDQRRQKQQEVPRARRPEQEGGDGARAPPPWLWPCRRAAMFTVEPK